MTTHSDIHIEKTSTEAEHTQWAMLLDILRHLRSEDGCPWDKEQSVSSIRPHIIEECSELLEAIGILIDKPSEAAHEHLQEEMGDVLLVLIMMMVIYDSERPQVLAHIIEQLNDKLVRRHPHVFENVKIENESQLLSQWNKIKTEVEGKKKTSIDEYKNYMHVLERTKEVQKKLAKEHGMLDKSVSEKSMSLSEKIAALSNFEGDMPHKDSGENFYTPSPHHIEEAIGDALYALVDIAREFKVSPTAALSRKLAQEIDKVTR